MKDICVGQLAVINYNINGEKYWAYGVITEIFDGRYLVVSKKKQTMVILDEEKDSLNEFINGGIKATPLFKNGEPVMAKKNIFGKYKF